MSENASLWCKKLLDSSALVLVHPEVKNWIKYARFEEKHGYIAHSRKVYERSVDFFGEDYVNEHLFVAFAKFEEAQKEVNDKSNMTSDYRNNPLGFCQSQLYCQSFCLFVQTERSKQTHLYICTTFIIYKITVPLKQWYEDP